MTSRYEVEVTITSGKDLKNVNWRHGDLRPYAVVWVDQSKRCSTHVDEENGDDPIWNDKLIIPFDSPIEDSTLYIDVVHANADEEVKPLVGSAKLRLRDVVDEVGLGSLAEQKLKLKRPSGRPHGKLDVKVIIRQPRYGAPDPYAPQYGVPPPRSRDYEAAPYGNPYGAPQGYGAPPSGYGAPTPYGQSSYGQPAYEQGGSYGQPPAYEQGGSYGQQQPQHQGYPEEKKKSKFGGMGTGLAVGAVAGVLGGIALTEGFEAFKDHVADDAAERVEENLREEDEEEEEEEEYAYGEDDE